MPLHGTGTPTSNLGIPTVQETDGPDGATQINDVAFFLDQAAAAQDTLQAGVVGVNDGTIISGAVNSGTGALTGHPLAGFAWVLTAAGLLVRGSIPNTAFNLTPASLPAASKSAVVGIDLVAPASGVGPCTVAVSLKGTDQTTTTLALANSPATATGRLRIYDIAITNTAGSYSLGSARDRRPWARGAFATATATGGNYTNAVATLTALDATNLSLRVELSGAPIRITLNCTGWNASGGNDGVNTSCLVDGANLDSRAAITTSTSTVAEFAGYVYNTTLAAGSHLFQPSFSPNGGGTATIAATTTEATVFTVEEIVRGNGINGTA